MPVYGHGDVAPRKVNISGTDRDVMYAGFEVAPVGSRLQLGKISAGQGVTSFKVEGIFINNYFGSMKTDLSFNGITAEDNGVNPVNFTDASGTYATDIYMRDYTAGGVIGGAPGTSFEPVKDFWAYNVFPTKVKDQLPHIVIRFAQVVLDGNITINEPRFTTVRLVRVDFRVYKWSKCLCGMIFCYVQCLNGKITKHWQRT